MVLLMDARIITGAALAVLDEVGLDKLSMRLVAARLGVQVGGLYYYVADKAALLRHVADELCDQIMASSPGRPGPADWEADARKLCQQMRAVLNRHRDSARVLAASPLNGSLSALALMERLIAILEPGVGAERAHNAADTLMAYVTGFVLGEQSDTPTRFPLTLEELAARFPRVFRGAGGDDDVQFTMALTAIMTGFGGPAGQLSA
jgi:TetR/AcrR family transcriptional regulator, tetracycline repressor protein